MKSETEVKKKRKISSKEMFRTIAFEYKQDEKISIDLLSEVVSNIFYPNEVTGEARRRYKTLIYNILKEASHYEKAISELDFCKAMVKGVVFRIKSRSWSQRSL